MKKNILYTLILFLNFNLFCQQNVTKVDKIMSEQENRFGFYYALPKTNFQINVLLEKSTYYKGIYSDYAEKLLNLNNGVKEFKTVYSLKNIEIAPFLSPDISQLYFVEYSKTQLSKEFHKTSLLYENEKSFSCSQISDNQIPNFYKNFSNLTYSETDYSYIDTKIINGVITQEPVVKTTKVDKSLEQKAQEAANMIMSIRKNRFELLTGTQEINYSMETVKYMIEELDELENNYLGLFVGFCVKNEVKETITITPDNRDKYFMFSISPDKGITYEVSANANNYYLEARNECITTKSNINNIANAGYRIRNAVPVKLCLYVNNKLESFFGIYPIYQYGIVCSLPLKLDSYPVEKEFFIF